MRQYNSHLYELGVHASISEGRDYQSKYLVLSLGYRFGCRTIIFLIHGYLMKTNQDSHVLYK